MTFKTMSRLTISNATGVIAICQNKPFVTPQGELSQSSSGALFHHAYRDLPDDAVITDTKFEEITLEEDYTVQCPPSYLNEQGITFALASILEWKHPIDNTPIRYEDGEFTVFRSIGSIFDLDKAFSTFAPCTDLATTMAIVLRFKPSLRFDPSTLKLQFGYSSYHPSGNQPQFDDDVMLREICREAILSSTSVQPIGKWDGSVPLSMVALTVAPESTEHVRQGGESE